MVRSGERGPSTDMDERSISISVPSDMKLALAIALLRFKKQNKISFNQTYSTSSSSLPDAIRWKRKAKERKKELLLLRQELEKLEDETNREVFPQIASCRCYFFDDIGNPSTRKEQVEASKNWIDEVLIRRFLRLLRWKERKRLDVPASSRRHLAFDNENDMESLCRSIDFLVDHSSRLSKAEKDSSLLTLSHQAVDLIFASLKNLSEKDQDFIEESVSGLILRLNERMCSIPESIESSASVSQFYTQHLLRKLGSEPFIGQRILVTVSQTICIQSERLLFMDAFNDVFPSIHGGIYMMIQLIEFLILDYLQAWMNNENFDWRLFEEGMRSLLESQKALRAMESRNGLYILYMERIIGELAKRVTPAASEGKLDVGDLFNLFC